MREGAFYTRITGAYGSTKNLGISLTYSSTARTCNAYYSPDTQMDI